jgi:hypothetical protein
MSKLRRSLRALLGHRGRTRDRRIHERDQHRADAGQVSREAFADWRGEQDRRR